MTECLTRIAIHGPPRSGTTWLGEIFNSSPKTIYRFQPLFSYALKGFLDEQSGAERIAAYFNKLECIQDNFLDQSDARVAGILPTFTKTSATHLVYKEVRYHNILPNLMHRAPDVLLLLIVRDPIATLESWIRAPREFRRDLGWKVEDEWRVASQKNQGKPEEFFGFDGWKRAVSIFHELQAQFPDRARIVRYEDLLAKTQQIVSDLFDFCALELSAQTSEFIDHSHSSYVDNPYSVYRDRFVNQECNSSLSQRAIGEILLELKDSQYESYRNNQTLAG